MTVYAVVLEAGLQLEPPGQAEHMLTSFLFCSIDEQFAAWRFGSGGAYCGRHHGWHPREVERMPYLSEEED